MDQKTPTGDRKETKTSIDSLLDLLNKYGRRDLTSIAVELGISPAIVESWVKILESGKLVRITYEMGKMYVSPSGKDGTEEEVTVKSEVTKSAIENEVELDKLILDKFSEKVQRLSSITNNVTAMYKQKLPEIQKVFSDLDKLYLPAEQKAKELDAIDADFKSKLAQVESSVAKTYSKIDSVGMAGKSKAGASGDEINALLKRAELARESINQLEDTKKVFYKSLDAEISQRVNEFKKMTNKSVNDIYESIKMDSKAADLAIIAIKEEMASAQHMNAEVKNIERDTEAARRLVERYKKEYEDHRARAAHEAEAYAKIFARGFETAKKGMDELKSAFGEVSELNQSITESTEQIEEIRKMIEQAKNELSEIRTQLNAVKTSKTITIDTKAKMLSELDAKKNRISERSKKIKDALSDAEAKMSGAPKNGKADKAGA